MQINDKLITYLEGLSCLTLDPAERERIKGDLADILKSMETLRALDTEGVPERSHPFDEVNALREDVVMPSFEQADILKNAPRVAAGAFVAPKIL